MEERNSSSVPELLLVDKPAGISSFGVICKLRKKFNVRKMGHAGTLDPLATGLLVVGIGTGTKRLKHIIGLPKEYTAVIRIGERRATGDLEGAVLETAEVPVLEEKLLSSAVSALLGIHRLPVSAYSAVKKQGVPMYRRARAAERNGELIQNDELPLRDMEVYEAELLSHACGDGCCTVTVRFSVASGTYIRSLAEALGRQLGYPATLAGLRRTRVGDFKIEDAIQL